MGGIGIFELAILIVVFVLIVLGIFVFRFIMRRM